MKIVTICGSMRFEKEMQKIASLLEIQNGWCVLQCVYNIGAVDKEDMFKIVSAHYKKIDISDAIYVINIGGYIGDSTKEEINYARQKGKEIIYLEKI